MRPGNGLVRSRGGSGERRGARAEKAMPRYRHGGPGVWPKSYRKDGERQRQSGRRGRHRACGQIGDGADSTIIERHTRGLRRHRRNIRHRGRMPRIRDCGARQVAKRRSETVRMPERQRELDRERKQRAPRSKSHLGSYPSHADDSPGCRIVSISTGRCRATISSMSMDWGRRPRLIRDANIV
jgi:hypothetical protein